MKLFSRAILCFTAFVLAECKRGEKTLNEQAAEDLGVKIDAPSDVLDNALLQLKHKTRSSVGDGYDTPEDVNKVYNELKVKSLSLRRPLDAYRRLSDRPSTHLNQAIQNTVANGTLLSTIHLAFPVAKWELEYVDSNMYFPPVIGKPTVADLRFIDGKSEYNKRKFETFLLRQPVSLGQNLKHALTTCSERFAEYMVSVCDDYITAVNSKTVDKLTAAMAEKLAIIAESPLFGSRVLQLIAQVFDRVMDIKWPKWHSMPFESLRRFRTPMHQNRWSEEFDSYMKDGTIISLAYETITEKRHPLDVRVPEFEKLAWKVVKAGYEAVATKAAYKFLLDRNLANSVANQRHAALEWFVESLKKSLNPKSTEIDRSAAKKMLLGTNLRDVFEKHRGLNAEIQNLIAEGELANSLHLEFPVTGSEFNLVPDKFVNMTLMTNLMHRSIVSDSEMKSAIAVNAKKFAHFLSKQVYYLGDAAEIAQKTRDSLQGSLEIVATKPLFGSKMLRHIGHTILTTLQPKWKRILQHLNPLKWWKAIMSKVKILKLRLLKVLMSKKHSQRKRVSLLGEFIFDFYAAGYDAVVIKAVRDFVYETGNDRRLVASRAAKVTDIANLMKKVSDTEAVASMDEAKLKVIIDKLIANSIKPAETLAVDPEPTESEVNPEGPGGNERRSS